MNQKKTGNASPKLIKSIWGVIMEYIALHLKFRRRGSEVFYWPICLSTVSRWQISWLDIRPTWALTWIWLPDPLYSWYNIKPQKIQVWLDMRNVGNQYDAFQNDNALMYRFISKLFNDMDFFVMWNKERVKKEYSTWSSCLDIGKQFKAMASVSGRP